MTTQTKPLPDDLAALDFQPPCNWVKCTSPAAFIAVPACCSHNIFLCAPHERAIEIMTREDKTILMKCCGHRHPARTSLFELFSRIERLR